MGFHSADLILVAAIKDGLDFLSKNTDHLEFVLSGFADAPLKKIVGPEYIAQAIKFIQENRISVAPFYDADINISPSVTVIASGDESDQFVGDYGYQQISKKRQAPVVYATWDCKAINGDELLVSRELSLEQRLWINAYVTNGAFSGRVIGILRRDGEDTKIILNNRIPREASLRGWRAESAPREYGYSISGSMDSVTVQAKITTDGDFSVHRLVTAIIRYCIKSRRMFLESLGFQLSRIAYSPAVLADDAQMIFESVITVSGKILEQWIEYEYAIPDPNSRIDIEAVVHSDLPANKDVIYEES